MGVSIYARYCNASCRATSCREAWLLAAKIRRQRPEMMSEKEVDRLYQAWVAAVDYAENILDEVDNPPQ